MKLRNLLWSFTTLLALSACDSEFDIPDLNTEGDEEVVVTYTVKLPEAIQSRAYSDGTKAKDLHYALYEVTDDITDLETASTLKPTLSENVTLVDGEADVKLNLIKGKQYQIAFWAQATNAPYTYHDNSRLVTVDYKNANSNDDDLDAFFAFEEIDAECAYGRTLFLTRAFAQINIGTHDMDEAKAMHLNVNRSTISTTAYTQLNLRTKEVSGKTEVKIDYKYADIPSGEIFPTNEENATEDPYTYVSMNYILAPVEEEKLPEVTLKVDGVFERTFENVPIKMNHRTNIYGNIFTDPASYKVTIRKEYDVEPWDGVSNQAKSPVDGVIEIGTAAELARLPERSNEHGNTYEGDYFKLTQDIDLNCKPWDPIAATEYVWGYDWDDDANDYITTTDPKFSGTFDGNGHTIYNLHIDLDKLQTTDRYYWDDEEEVNVKYQEVYRFAGLFGELSGATIKNLTIENVIIHNNSETTSSESTYTGILAGAAADSHFENIKIKGIVIVTADGSKCTAKNGYLGGLVGAADGACTFDGINIEVEEDGSYVSGSDCAYVGGLTGRFWEGTCSNVKSNLTVISSNPLGKKSSVGGLIGLTKQKARKFSNCSCSGTVTFNNYAGSVIDEDGDEVFNELNMGIGGLVGAGYEIVPAAKAEFTRCSFTGEIISNFVSTGDVTDYTETVQTNNIYWEYIGWIDSGMSWKTNNNCVTINNDD